MNVTSNLHVTIVNANEVSKWKDEDLQRILSSWQYKATKVKLTSLGMFDARKEDYCAGFDCVVKDGKRVRSILKLNTKEDSLHITVCYMTKNSYIKTFEPQLEAEEQY